MSFEINLGRSLIFLLKLNQEDLQYWEKERRIEEKKLNKEASSTQSKKVLFLFLLSLFNFHIIFDRSIF